MFVFSMVYLANIALFVCVVKLKFNIFETLFAVAGIFFQFYGGFWVFMVLI